MVLQAKTRQRQLGDHLGKRRASVNMMQHGARLLLKRLARDEEAAEHAASLDADLRRSRSAAAALREETEQAAERMLRQARDARTLLRERTPSVRLAESAYVA